MNQIHEYAARIDYDLWNDMTKVKSLDAGTTSINAMVNEGLRMVRDKKMEQIAQQRKQRSAFESISDY
ncbi:MAG: hypothetical protein ACI9JL_004143 [Paracoccaceae bacterium]|jgi:hypothetical protein